MWQADIRSAFESFPFDAPFPEHFPTQMHDQGQWADPAWIKPHLSELGFTAAASKVGRGRYHIDNADDFIYIFGSMLGWVTKAWWSEATRAAHPLEEIHELTKRHLHDKYNGQGWTLQWAVVYSTGRVQK